MLSKYVLFLRNSLPCKDLIHPYHTSLGLRRGLRLYRGKCCLDLRRYNQQCCQNNSCASLGYEPLHFHSCREVDGGLLCLKLERWLQGVHCHGRLLPIVLRLRRTSHTVRLSHWTSFVCPAIQLLGESPSLLLRRDNRNILKTLQFQIQRLVQMHSREECNYRK